jgi:uncharacterized cupredoxin-like copper-binding protein
MTSRKLIVGLLVLALGIAGTSAVASGASAPKRANIKAVQTVKLKVNRYIQDGLRWDKDTYTVASGGTLHVVNNAPDEGSHTLTVVKEKDLPRTVAKVLNCKICNTLGEAHGADPNSDAPPKFLFLENGVGQATPPNVDRAGDSAVVDAKKGASVDLKVTAKKGTTLYFMCLIHPWMQGEVKVK